jgi:hypothetical protein
MRNNRQKRHHLSLWCRFHFFYRALGTHIEAGATEDALALIDLVGDTNVNTAFGAHQGAAATGDAFVTDEVVLIMFHG